MNPKNLPTISAARDVSWALSCLAYGQKNFHHWGLILRLVLGYQSQSGIAITSSAANNYFIRKISANYLNRIFEFTSQAIAISRGEKERLGIIETILSDRDTDLIGIASPLDENRVHVKNRKIDTLFPRSSSRVDLMHIAEPAQRALEVIAGASEILNRDRPLIVLEHYDLADTKLLDEFFCKRNYVLLDSTFAPVAFEQNKFSSSTSTETYFIAAHHDFFSASGILTCLWPRGNYWSSNYEWQENLLACFSREARNGGIKFVGSISETTIYKFDDTIECEGFYAAEGDERNVWRWLGPRPDAKILLPNQGEGNYCVKLTVSGYLNKKNIDELRIFFDGKELSLTTEMSTNHYAAAVISTEIHVSTAYTSGLLDFILSIPTVSRASSEDSRLLGISLSSIELGRI